MKIIENNDCDLYIVDIVGVEGGSYELDFDPIVAFAIKTEDDFIYSYPIPLIHTISIKEDEPIIYNERTGHWGNLGCCGTGKDELLAYLKGNKL